MGVVVLSVSTRARAGARVAPARGCAPRSVRRDEEAERNVPGCDAAGWKELPTKPMGEWCDRRFLEHDRRAYASRADRDGRIVHRLKTGRRPWSVPSDTR